MSYRIAILAELLDVMEEELWYDRADMTRYLIEKCEISDGPSVVNSSFRRFSRNHFFDRTEDSICLTDRVAAEDYLRDCRRRMLNHILEESG